ncbi:MAG: hypothetical protein ACI9EF_000246 [Pseudohongiellaceae bacterium]|jgi:uncharacterized protein (TIGR00290 family)
MHRRSSVGTLPPMTHPPDSGSSGNTWLSWSSGKDSAWALYQLRKPGGSALSQPPTALFTTVNAAADRVAMHAVRRELLQRQADAAGLPLHVVEIPFPCSNEQYAEAMNGLLALALAANVNTMAFGDLYLEDIRAYRETMLKETPIAPVFPLWLQDTAELSRRMVDEGLVAHLSCIDPKVLPTSFAGRVYDHALLDELPEGIDPCGENGEFHTFVSAGPMLSETLNINLGQVIERDGFVFADLTLCES